MKLSEMEAELSRMVRDDSLRALLVAWINNAILEVATDFELASLRLVDWEPVTVRHLQVALADADGLP